MNSMISNSDDIDSYLSELSSQINTKNQRLMQRWGISSEFSGSSDSSPRNRDDDQNTLEIVSETYSTMSETRMRLDYKEG